MCVSQLFHSPTPTKSKAQIACRFSNLALNFTNKFVNEISDTSLWSTVLFFRKKSVKKKERQKKAPFLHGSFISSKIYGNPLKTAVYFFAGHKFIDKKTSRQTYGLLEVPSTFSVQFLDVVCARWVIECHLYTRCHFMNERHIMNGLVELSCAAYYIAVRRKSDW